MGGLKSTADQGITNYSGPIHETAFKPKPQHKQTNRNQDSYYLSSLRFRVYGFGLRVQGSYTRISAAAEEYKHTTFVCMYTDMYMQCQGCED